MRAFFKSWMAGLNPAMTVFEYHSPGSTRTAPRSAEDASMP